MVQLLRQTHRRRVPCSANARPQPGGRCVLLLPPHPTLQQERLLVFVVTRGLTPWMMDGMRLMCSRRRTGGRSRPRKIALRGRPLGDRFGRTPNAGAPGDDDQCSSRAGRGSSARTGRGSGARAAARAWAHSPDGRKACVDLRLESCVSLRPAARTADSIMKRQFDVQTRGLDKQQRIQ